MRRHLKDYFIPHEGNEYKPHSLQKAAMIGMVVLVVLSFTLANVQSLIWISSEWMVSAILPSVIVDLTNEARSENNLGTLRQDSVLAAAAQQKAEDMARYSYFAHYSPTGVSPWFWFNQQSYNFVNAGENLAVYFTDTGELVNAWLNSESHRANIMNGAYTEIGIGTAEGTYEGFSTIYVVQFFGTPAAVPTQVAVAVPTPPVPTPIVLAEETVASIENPEETTPSPPEVNPQIAGSEEIVTEVENTEVTLSTDRDPVIVISETIDNEVATQTEIVEIEIKDESVVLYSDLISTTTGGIPASIDPNNTEVTSKYSGILGIATQPQKVLQTIYILIGMFVVGALALSVFIEIRRQQPVQIVYSAGLVAVMAGLFYVHVAITSGALIV